MNAGASESLVASRLRLEAAQNPNVSLWRNQSGAFTDDNGRLVRFGLGNDSKAVNAVLKSHDFIGIRRVLILPEHVGQTIGQFVSRETKPEGWTYRPGDARARAQQAWSDLINSYGGDARFCTGEGSL